MKRRYSFYSLLFTIVLFCVNLQGQVQKQVIGTFPQMDGGFEGQTVGACSQASSISSGATYDNWTVQTAGNGTLQSSPSRTGSVSVNFYTTSTAKRLQSPTNTSTVISTSTSYVVQCYYRTAGSTGTAASMQHGISNAGTGSPVYYPSATPYTTLAATNGSWAKWTSIISTNTTTSNSPVGIVRCNTPTMGVALDIDDFCIYPGSSPDVTAPNAPTSPVVSVLSGTSLKLDWTAASGGVDGGGYMIVRGTSDPSTTPNANGIYAVNNTVVSGQTVVYIGTNNTFTDVSLTSGTTYYYRIYTVDKAFNYSSAATCNGTPSAGTPSVTLAAISSVGAASIAQATNNNILTNFSLAVSTANATLNSIGFRNSGTYTGSDLTNLKLWYNSTNSFGSASAIKTLTSLSNVSPQSFSGLSQQISSGATGYFWITADIPGSAAIGNTITAADIATTDLTFSATVSSSGSVSASGTQTISAGTSGITLSGISTVGASGILLSSTNNIIYNFKLDVASVAATLNQVTIPNSGTYDGSDFTNLKLWYNSSNNGPGSGATAISTLSTPLNTTPQTFGSLSQSIAIGGTGYFWVTADVASGAADGHTITVTPALAQSNFTFSGSTSWTIGTINAGGTQTISAVPDVALGNNPGGQVGAGNIAQAATSQVLANFTLAVTTAGTQVTQVTFANSGTYASGDFSNFKLWYNSSNNGPGSGATAIQTISNPTNASPQTFASLSQNIAKDATGYFWITGDVGGGSTVGHTVTVSALTSGNFSFTPSVNFSGSMSAPGEQTISAGTSNVTLSEISAVSSGNINLSSTNNVIYNFKLDVSNVSTTVTQVNIPNSGSYDSDDFTNFKLWYNSTNSFGSASTIKTISSPTNTSPQSFSSLSQAIAFGATGYFWITADVASGATVSNTITVTPALSTGDISLSGTISWTTGTISAGGTQTIVATSNASDYFRSKQTGNWGDASTWESSADNSAWINATLTPTTTANAVTILDGHTVTVAANVSADQVTVNSGGVLTVSASQTLTVANGTGTDLQISSGGTFNLAGTFASDASSTIIVDGLFNNQVNNAAFSAGSGAMTVNGTYKVTGLISSNAQLSFTNVTFASGTSGGTLYIASAVPRLPYSNAGNVTYEIVDNNSILNGSSTTTTIGGNFRIKGTTGIINQGSGTSGRTLTISGTFYIEGGEYDITGGSTGVQVINAQNVDISGGKLYFSALSGTSGTLYVAGNLTHSGGIIGNSTTGGTIVFNGSVPQTITTTGFTSTAVNLTINNSGSAPNNTVTLNGALTSGTVTLTAGKLVIGSGGTVNNTGSFSITSGTWQVDNGGTYVHNTTSSASTPLGSATLNSGSTFIYRGSSTLTPAFSLSGRTFGNLTMESTSGSLSLNGSGSGTLAVNGNLSVGGSGAGTVALSMSSYTGPINITGNYEIASGSSYTGGTHTISLTGNWTDNGTFTASTSSTTFNGSSSQSITKSGGETFNNLTINNSSGGVSLGSDVTVSGTSTLTSGALSIGANTLTMNGALSTSSGTLTGGATSNIAIGGSSTYTLPAVSGGLNNLTQGSSGTITLGGATTVNGTLNLTGGTFNANSNLTMGGSGVITYNGGTLTGYNNSTGTPTVTLSSGGSYAPPGPLGSLTISAGTTVTGAVTVFGAVNINETTTFQGGLTATGTVTVAEGKTFNAGTGLTHHIQGNWNNLGTLSAGTSKFVFDGTSAQTMHGSTWYDLEINNPAGVTMETDEDVTNSLILTSGRLNVAGFNLTLGASATVSGTPSASNMVVADGSGEMRKVFTGNGSFTFPVGDNTGTAEYSPVAFTLNSNGGLSSAYVAVKLSNSKHTNNSASSHYLSRYWTMTSSGITSPNYTASFYYVNADINGTEASLYGGKYTGSGNIWTGLGGVDADNNRIQANSLTTFSDFSAMELTALPVELTTFTSSVTGRDVQLAWNTATEMNSSLFAIERSTDKLSWLRVGSVAASGYSNAPKDYTFTDKMLNTGKYCYRLKIIDNDGTFEYSPVIEAEVSVPAEFAVSQNYPNPFNPSTKINYDIPEDSRIVLSLYGITGEKVAELVNGEVPAGYYTHQVDMGGYNLSSGIYFYKLVGSSMNGERKYNVVRKMMYLR